MKTRAALVLAVLGSAASAYAQQTPETQGSVTYSLSFTEFNHGTGVTGSPTEWTNPVAGNIAGGTIGTIDPGEGALIRITLSMSGTPGGFDQTNQVNTGSPLTWNPSLPTLPVGSSGTGNLSGFWNGDVNLKGDNGAATANGTWSDGSTFYGNAIKRKLLTWTAAGVSGSGAVVPGGSTLTDMQPSVLSSDADGISHVNNTFCWQGFWIPAAGSARTVSWNVLLGSLGFLSNVTGMDQNYANGYTFPVPLKVLTLFGPKLSIPVAAVPGPSSLALLGLGGLVAARRRR